MKLNTAKKATTSVIVASILLSSVSGVFADNNTSKEEVVYVKLSDNGNVNNVYIINSFDINSDKEIVDYGDYTNVINLSTEIVLKYSNGLLDTKVNSDESKFFYQGDMKTKEIPWNINIEYTLDGNKIDASNLAGKSGKLEIKIDIDKNDNVAKEFFENYAIQMSLSLDENKCKNIVAEGGTIANVGSTKSISYIKLPGETASYTLSADINNFEMDPMVINGLNMGMNVNVDVSEMTDSLDTLVDAVEELNKGASDLKTGIGNYKTGINQFYTSSAKLFEGTKSLQDGINTFNKGASSLTDGTKSLNDGLNALSQGSASYKQNVNNYANSVNQLASQLKATLPPEVYQQLQLDDLVAGANALSSGYENIDKGINSSKEGANQLYNGSSQMVGSLSQLSQGLGDLGDGITALNSGREQLVGGIDEIYKGASKLSDGTKEFKNKTSNLPDEINSQINELTSKYSNSDFEPISFASNKNDNVESVQFTIRTEGITIEEKKEAVKDVKAEESFWQKLMNVFKKEK